jgi:NADP-dependent 3-hydroxy acid dehydrogenase YdfG
MKNLAGRTAFVTGAASGIGLGIATALSQAGVKVMLCDIEEEALAKAISGLKLTNADVDGVRADVSLKAELQAAADATVARYGRVHILVNNAGVGGGGGYGRWTDASWNWVLGVNLMSVIWGIEIFGPLIEAHGEGGQIVSTASIVGLIPGSALPYNVTKYGVVALSEGLRATLAPREIGMPSTRAPRGEGLPLPGRAIAIFRIKAAGANLICSTLCVPDPSYIKTHRTSRFLRRSHSLLGLELRQPTVDVGIVIYNAHSSSPWVRPPNNSGLLEDPLRYHT